MKPLKVVAGSQVEALRKSLANDMSKQALRIEDEQRQHRQMVAIECTTVLLGSFRKCDADDPEIYSRAIEHEFARYDVDIQREVADPGKWKYAPWNAHEVRERCEKIASGRARIAEREANLAKQLAERRRLDALQAERKALTYRAPGAAPAGGTRADLERRQAERILARYRAAAEASTRHAEIPSVFAMDPAGWDT
jgi:hypothetical protein